jgi:hypothetical protein
VAAVADSDELFRRPGGTICRGMKGEMERMGRGLNSRGRDVGLGSVLRGLKTGRGLRSARQFPKKAAGG